MDMVLSNDVGVSTFNVKRVGLKNKVEKILDTFVEENKSYFNEGVKLAKQMVSQEIKKDYQIPYVILTGQYLGSYVYTKLFNNTKRIINNDIDMFIPFYEMNFNDTMGSIDSMYDGLSTLNDYSIIDSQYFRPKNINITFVQDKITKYYFNKPELNNYKLKKSCTSIIESFDINSVKIGIIYDTINSKYSYYISEDYLNFVITGQLTLTSKGNWRRSIFRLIKKGVEFTDVHNSKLLSAIVSNNINNDSYRIKLPNHLEMLIKKNTTFDFNEVNDYLELVISSLKVINNKLITIDLLDNNKTAKCIFEYKIDEFLKYLGFNIDIAITTENYRKFSCITIDKNLNYTQIIKDTLFLKDIMVDLTNQPHLVYHYAKFEILAQKQSIKKLRVINDYLKKLKISNNIRSKVLVSIISENYTTVVLSDLNIFSVINNHTELSSILTLLMQISKSFKYSLNVINKIYNSINEYINNNYKENAHLKKYINLEKFGILGSLSGLIEYEDIFISIVNKEYSNIADYFVKEFSIKLEKINSSNDSLLPDEIKSISYSKDDLKIKELVTKMDLRIEGSEMHNCVGGYVNNVHNGNSIIFSIKSRTDKKFRYTLELQGSTYAEFQCLTYSNKLPIDEHRKVLDTIVKELQEKLKSQNRKSYFDNTDNVMSFY